MDDNTINPTEENVMFEVAPESTPPGAADFSMTAQKDKFLGGAAQEKIGRPEDKISKEVREANLRIQREVFPNNKSLFEAYFKYTNPYSKGLNAEQMRQSLDQYVLLAGQDEGYQSIMAELRGKLPEQVNVYRGQTGNDSPRGLENYSVLREHAEIFAMGEEGFKENAVVVEKSVSRDQIVALGSRRESEVIVKTATQQVQQPLPRAA